MNTKPYYPETGDLLIAPTVTHVAFVIISFDPSCANKNKALQVQQLSSTGNRKPGYYSVGRWRKDVEYRTNRGWKLITQPKVGDAILDSDGKVVITVNEVGVLGDFIDITWACDCGHNHSASIKTWKEMVADALTEGGRYIPMSPAFAAQVKAFARSPRPVVVLDEIFSFAKLQAEAPKFAALLTKLYETKVGFSTSSPKIEDVPARTPEPIDTDVEIIHPKVEKGAQLIAENERTIILDVSPDLVRFKTINVIGGNAKTYLRDRIEFVTQISRALSFKHLIHVAPMEAMPLISWSRGRAVAVERFTITQAPKCKDAATPEESTPATVTPFLSPALPPEEPKTVDNFFTVGSRLISHDRTLTIIEVSPTTLRWHDGKTNGIDYRSRTPDFETRVKMQIATGQYVYVAPGELPPEITWRGLKAIGVVRRNGKTAGWDLFTPGARMVSVNGVSIITKNDGTHITWTNSWTGMFHIVTIQSFALAAAQQMATLKSIYVGPGKPLPDIQWTGGIGIIQPKQVTA